MFNKVAYPEGIFGDLLKQRKYSEVVGSWFKLYENNKPKCILSLLNFLIHVFFYFFIFCFF
jgi:hypothetical protein